MTDSNLIDFASRKAVEFATKLQSAMQSGNPQGALEAIAKDCVVTAPRILPWGGVTHGLDAFTKTLTVMGGFFSVTLQHFEVHPVGDQAMAIINATFTSRRSGRAVPVTIIELYRADQRGLIEITAFYQDPGPIAELARE